MALTVRHPLRRPAAIILAATCGIVTAMSTTLAQETTDPEVCDAYISAIVDGVPSVQPGTSQELLESCVLSSFLPDDGQAIVWEDLANGFVCIQVRQGRGRGSACTDMTGSDPMVAGTGAGTGPDEPIIMVVVDPQHRLISADYERDGLPLEETEVQVIQPNGEGGLAVAALVPVWPDTVTVDLAGEPSYVVEVQEDLATAREETGEAPFEDS